MGLPVSFDNISRLLYETYAAARKSYFPGKRFCPETEKNAAGPLRLLAFQLSFTSNSR